MIFQLCATVGTLAASLLFHAPELRLVGNDPAEAQPPPGAHSSGKEVALEEVGQGMTVDQTPSPTKHNQMPKRDEDRFVGGVTPVLRPRCANMNAPYRSALKKEAARAVEKRVHWERTLCNTEKHMVTVE
jgi:hypothetical protein